jgi:hypothetical protein
MEPGRRGLVHEPDEGTPGGRDGLARVAVGEALPSETA